MRNYPLIVILALALSACATNEKGDKLVLGANLSSYSVQAPVIALEEDINTELQTADYGDIIFEQSLYPLKSVKTTADMSQQVKFIGLNAGKLELQKDTPLYSVFHNKIAGQTYCVARAIDEKSSAVEKILLGGLIGTSEQREQGQRYCLTDVDEDSQFDEVRVMQDHAIYMVQGGLVSAAPVKLIDTVPYRQISDKMEMPKQRLGLELSNGGWVGNPILFVRALQGDVQQRVKADIIEIGKKEDLPKTVTFNGIAIEIIDYNKKNLTYRVRSAIKPGTSISLSTFTKYR